MWTTDKTRRAHLTPRPFRVAYLVPLNPSHILLDVLFSECMSRWGGRRTPIIITEGTSIAAVDLAFLDLWDADLIYSYVDIDAALRDRIAFCLAPAEIKIHEYPPDWHDDHALRPRQEQLHEVLRCTSVLPRLARFQESRSGKVREVLDKEPGTEVDRDLADSFGFLSDAVIHENLGSDARRLSYRTVENERYAPRFRGDESISYISEISEVEERVSKDTSLVLPMQMADMFCPHLNVLGYKTSWDDRLTIVVGDTESDRLLFWNSIHRYKSLDVFKSIQLLRFSPKRLQEVFPRWISHLCGGVRNTRRLDGNSAANVAVVSASLTSEGLESISKSIGSARGTMSSFKRTEGSAFDFLAGHDPRKKYEQGLSAWPAWLWITPNPTQSVRIERGEMDIPCVRPWHTEDSPLGPTTVGSWLCDIDIERTEDHSRYSNVVHHWWFPRRLALHAGVRTENYGPSKLRLRPKTRPTERGRLAIWDDSQWRRPTLRLPADISAFSQALFFHHPNSAAEKSQHVDGAQPYRFETIQISDKGRDLLGVLKFFRNLSEAIDFLTNPYLLKVISRLSPTDTGQDKQRISKLTTELINRLKDKEPTDEEFERTAKRVLALSALWVQKDSRSAEHINYQALKQILNETVKGQDERKGLDRFLKFLRNQNFLMQGYGWKCARCHHPNWAGLTEIENELECAICAAVEDAPVGGDANSHFKLNSFVSGAFGPASAQDAVIWCLGILAERAQHSLMLTPTLDIKGQTIRGHR